MRTDIAHQRLEERNQGWFPSRRRENPSEFHAVVQVALALIAERSARRDSRPPLDVTAEVIGRAPVEAARPRAAVSSHEARDVVGQRRSVAAILARYLANDGTGQPTGSRSLYV